MNSVSKNMEECGGELNDKQVKEVSAGDIWRSEVSLFPFVIQDLWGQITNADGNRPWVHKGSYGQGVLHYLHQ